LRNGDEQKDGGNVREINTQVLTFVQRPSVRIGPEIKVDVEQERVGKSDADHRNGVGDAQKRGPGVRTKVEQTMKRDHEIARVPTAHGQGEKGKKTLDIA